VQVVGTLLLTPPLRCFELRFTDGFELDSWSHRCDLGGKYPGGLPPEEERQSQPGNEFWCRLSSGHKRRLPTRRWYSWCQTPRNWIDRGRRYKWRERVVEWLSASAQQAHKQAISLQVAVLTKPQLFTKLIDIRDRQAKLAGL